MRLIRGLLITNAFMKAGSFSVMRNLFLEAARREGIELISRTNAEFLFSCPENIDFVLFYDKDIRLARRFEQNGLPVFNSARAIALCDDKTWTDLVLRNHRIPQPETVVCPLTFPGLGYGDMAFLNSVGERLGYPFVIKEGCGSFGQQVYLAHNINEAREIMNRIGEKPALFQKFIFSSAGQDKRLFVVDGEVIAAIRRKNLHGDFRANIENGGNAEACDVTEEEKLLALAACKSLNLDFGGVDLLDDRGTPLVCEVNSNAHFGGLLSVTGVNPADYILRFIRRRVCGA